MELLEQVLVQAELHIHIIFAASLMVLIIIEGIHVLQLRKINRKLRFAGQKLAKYMDSVFDDTELEIAEPIVDAMESDDIRKADSQKADSQKNEYQEAYGRQKENAGNHGEYILSKQENDMRTAIAQHKKQKNDTQLLDSVLKEIFD